MESIALVESLALVISITLVILMASVDPNRVYYKHSAVLGEVLLHCLCDFVSEHEYCNLLNLVEFAPENKFINL